MFTFLKTIKRPKKRYIALGLLAIEFASLPAAAHIVMQSLPNQAIEQTNAVLLDESDTQKRYVVTSDNAFHISANDFKGHVNVSVQRSGNIGTMRFGENAQMPGAALSCSKVDDTSNTIYQSVRKITINDGNPLSQAVLVVIDYKPESDKNPTAPDILFTSGQSSAEQNLRECLDNKVTLKSA